MTKRPHRIHDITGQRFGRLVAIEQGDSIVTPCGTVKTTWVCFCDCGNRITTKRGNLINGYTKSCGCLHSENLTKRNTTHGMYNSRTYKCWQNMIQRCTNKNNISWKRYGGRGISVCDRWKESFDSFLTDMGICKPGYEIDRINGNGNYEPENCRWATRKQQMSNVSYNRVIEFNGRLMIMQSLADEIGMPVSTLHYRLMHWPIDRVLNDLAAIAAKVQSTPTQQEHAK